MPLRLLCLALLLLTSFARAAAPSVKTYLEDWTDAKRDGRVVPVKVYLPSDLTPRDPAPVVLFSHGLGGSREGYGYIAEHWARNGYVVVALQHAGSDSGVWRDQKTREGALQRMLAAASVENYVHRVRDVQFAIDHLAALAQQPGHPLRARIDAARVAVAGHSFGAYTALAIAGQIAHLGAREVTFLDARVACAIAMSPSPPPKGEADTAFTRIGMPVYHLTGTHDKVLIQPIDPVERKVPYEKTTAPDQYLLVLKNADHMTFSGRGAMARAYAAQIQQSTTAFLDAYLKKDETRKAWLRETYAGELRKVGEFAWK